MFNSLLSGISSKVMLGAIAVLFGIVLSLGTYSYFVSSKNSDLTLEVVQKDKDIKNLIDGYNQTLEIERALSKESAITQEQKQEVIKTTSKVQAAVIKRGEIKQDEKSNFTIVNF